MPYLIHPRPKRGRGSLRLLLDLCFNTDNDLFSQIDSLTDERSKLKAEFREANGKYIKDSLLTLARSISAKYRFRIPGNYSLVRLIGESDRFEGQVGDMQIDRDHLDHLREVDYNKIAYDSHLWVSFKAGRLSIAPIGGYHLLGNAKPNKARLTTAPDRFWCKVINWGEWTLKNCLPKNVREEIESILDNQEDTA